MTLGFEKYPVAVNCPTHRTVATLRECKAASDALGLTYHGSYREFLRPAGCNWRAIGEMQYSFFNTIVDPSQTSPNNVEFGGVCVKGKFGIIREGTYLHKSLVIHSKVAYFASALSNHFRSSS